MGEGGSSEPPLDPPLRCSVYRLVKINIANIECHISLHCLESGLSKLLLINICFEYKNTPPLYPRMLPIEVTRPVATALSGSDV